MAPTLHNTASEKLRSFIVYGNIAGNDATGWSEDTNGNFKAICKEVRAIL